VDDVCLAWRRPFFVIAISLEVRSAKAFSKTVYAGFELELVGAERYATGALQ
jgi:hypothetical protein